MCSFLLKLLFHLLALGNIFHDRHVESGNGLRSRNWRNVVPHPNELSCFVPISLFDLKVRLRPPVQFLKKSPVTLAVVFVSEVEERHSLKLSGRCSRSFAGKHGW